MADGAINLRRARKAKARREKDKVADQNRHLHGRTKAEKLDDRRARETAERHLDGHKRDPEKP